MFMQQLFDLASSTYTCLVTDDNSCVFTGDTLLIRGCGRSDFQEGSTHPLFNSIISILFALPDDCIVYPGHDYNAHLQSTIGQEKQYNARAGGGASFKGGLLSF